MLAGPVARSDPSAGVRCGPSSRFEPVRAGHTGPGGDMEPTHDHGEQRGQVDELSTPQLLSRLSEQTSLLVRDEVALAKAELQQSVKKAGLGAGLFGSAGVVSLYGVGAVVAAAILGLAT